MNTAPSIEPAEMRQQAHLSFFTRPLRADAKQSAAGGVAGAEGGGAFRCRLAAAHPTDVLITCLIVIFCDKISPMEKSTFQTAAIMATVIATAWLVGGEVKANTAAIEENVKAIDELREDMRELRILLVLHISGHDAAQSAADGESGETKE